MIPDRDIDSTNSVDDAFLQEAASSIPKEVIFLIEDIDCAFSSRDDFGWYTYGVRLMLHDSTWYSPGPPSIVTLLGLLNVIDGIGSEEGVLFFATVGREFS